MSKLSPTCGILCSAKTYPTTGLSGQVHCHGESATFWIPTFIITYDTTHHGDFSTFVNINVN
jgi:hypothetical protein